MRFRCGGTTNQQRQGKALTFHLSGYIDHFIQRWRDQAGKTDDIGILFTGCFQDFITRHHDAKIDNFIVVTLQYHTHNVFTDVMYITFYRRQHDFTVAATLLLAGFDVRFQIRHCLLHYAGRFHHLWQEHFPVTKQIADHVHPGHQRPFNNINRTFRLLTSLFGVIFNKFSDAFYQRIFQTFFHIPATPFRQLLALTLISLTAAIAFGHFQHPFGGITTAVLNHIFHRFTQLFRQVIVNRQLTGIHNPHIHPIADGVIEEHRMNRFTHGIITAEGERNVRHTTGDHRIRQFTLDIFASSDKVHCVIVVFIDPGRDRKDIRVKDNIFRWEARFFRQQLVGTATNFDFTFTGIRLTVFIKGHHHHGGTITAYQAGMMQEDIFSLFHGDGVHNPFTLDTLQPFFDDIPFRGVDHNRHTGNIRFPGNQVKEAHHRRFRIQHPFIHIDVDDLGTVFHLLAGNIQRFGIFFFFDQTFKFC